VADIERQTKHRVIGAIVWFLFLILWVPSWYAEPVKFTPNGEGGVSLKQEQSVPIAKHAYQLPPTEPAKERPAVVKSQQSGSKTANKEQTLEKESTRKEPKQTAPKQASTGLKTTSTQTKDKPGSLPNLSEDELLADPAEAKGWFVRLASFKQIEKANKLLGRVEERYEAFIQPLYGGKMYAVTIGPFATASEAKRAKQVVDKRYYVNSLVFQRK
jgi:cell division septation protein DedD